MNRYIVVWLRGIYLNLVLQLQSSHRKLAQIFLFSKARSALATCMKLSSASAKSPLPLIEHLQEALCEESLLKDSLQYSTARDSKYDLLFQSPEFQILE